MGAPGKGARLPSRSHLPKNDLEQLSNNPCNKAGDDGQYQGGVSRIRQLVIYLLQNSFISFTSNSEIAARFSRPKIPGSVFNPYKREKWQGVPERTLSALYSKGVFEMRSVGPPDLLLFILLFFFFNPSQRTVQSGRGLWFQHRNYR